MGTCGLTEIEIVAYSRDITTGLSYLHSLRPKVFHRDIKPGNIILFQRPARGTCVLSGSEYSLVPQAKLADFGIAKVFEAETSGLGTATVIGTPHYFAPELCRGEIYDERADAWSLGCVMYEMMCLHKPFHRAEANLG